MNELVTSLSASLDTNYSSSQTSSDDQQIVYNFILSRLPQAGEPLSLAAAHHFENPGKMLRARMVMRGAHLLSVDKLPQLDGLPLLSFCITPRWCTTTYAMVISCVAVSKQFGQNLAGMLR